MSLEEKIQNRETELQIAYDITIDEKRKLEHEIYERQVKLKEVNARILKIESRAIAQGVLHVLKT